jgi:hypothetical protein
MGGLFVGYLIPKGYFCPLQSSSSCLLDSKMIRGWFGLANGEVKTITNRELSISGQEENLKIFIPEDAVINSLTGKGPEKANFEDIKVGDKVEVQFKFVASDQNQVLEGSIVNILNK